MSVAAPTPEVSNSSGGDVDMASPWRGALAQEVADPPFDDYRRAPDADRGPDDHAAISIGIAVLIESRDNVYLRPDADKITTDLTVDAEAVTSQAQIILSRDLAREVINKLKLGDRPEFDSALNGVSPIRALLGLIGIGKDPLSMTPRGAGASGLLRPA